MILEAVRLLQEGQLEQAEYLLLEGAKQRANSLNTALRTGCSIAALILCKCCACVSMSLQSHCRCTPPLARHGIIFQP